MLISEVFKDFIAGGLRGRDEISVFELRPTNLTGVFYIELREEAHELPVHTVINPDSHLGHKVHAEGSARLVLLPAQNCLCLLPRDRGEAV